MKERTVFLGATGKALTISGDIEDVFGMMRM
jgi:hypothetical protein